MSLQITNTQKYLYYLESLPLPCWCLHLVVVGELEYPNNPERYAAGSVATGRITLDGQVEG